MYMASLIKGISVILHERVRTGTDAFNAPIYSAVAVEVKNVLVQPVTDSVITSESQMDGKLLEYELSIPKGDRHSWEDSTVEFFGKKWQTVGPVKEWIEELLPLDWNRKIKAVLYE